MEENKLPNQEENLKTQPEMIVNDYGATRDDAVVIEEADRTVLLTEDETIIIEKPLPVNVVPKNRPRKIYAGMWGQVEIATVGVALLAAAILKGRDAQAATDDITGPRTVEIIYRKDRVNAGEVLDALQKQGFGIVDVSTRDPDLEDVFLSLTREAAA